MDAITFFFVFIGVVSATNALFKIVDAVEHYNPKKGGRHA